MVDEGRKAVTDALKRAAAFYFFRYGFAVTFEMGVMPWGSRKADLIANKINGSIVIVEVKSSLADFRTDKKWRAYMAFCDKFLFMMREDLYRKVRLELPDEVGVLCLNEQTGYAYMAKRCPVLELSPENRITTLARLAWRSGDLSRRTQRARARVFIGKKNPEVFQSGKPARKNRRPSKKTRRAASKYRKSQEIL